jgi:arginine and glutamate-rich protein 1
MVNVELEQDALERIAAAVAERYQAALVSPELQTRIEARLKEERARLEARLEAQLQDERTALLDKRRKA